jgi:hypothetical protein
VGVVGAPQNDVKWGGQRKAGINFPKFVLTENGTVALTWVMFQSHRAGKMRTNGIFLFLLRLFLDLEINIDLKNTDKSWTLTSLQLLHCRYVYFQTFPSGFWVRFTLSLFWRTTSTLQYRYSLYLFLDFLFLFFFFSPVPYEIFLSGRKPLGEVNARGVLYHITLRAL